MGLCGNARELQNRRKPPQGEEIATDLQTRFGHEVPDRRAQLASRYRLVQQRKPLRCASFSRSGGGVAADQHGRDFFVVFGLKLPDDRDGVLLLA